MSTKSIQGISQFETIVDQFKDRLFRFAFMRIGKREDAEDLVQDVFLALYRNLYGGNRIDDIQHYLFRGIFNTCTDYYRRKRLLTVNLDAASEVTGDDDKDIFEEYVRIRILLDDLPSEQSEIVRLRCYDELTFRQIALLCDISEATAKSRYKYGIQHLRKKLKQDV